MKEEQKQVVLVIDDEQNYIDIITKTLKERNYKILQAVNGDMGVMVAKKFKPDIIITDWEMPGRDGIETILELKRDEDTKEIPVIMCTGIMTSSKNLDTALNAGAVDYIRKPVEPMEIISRINSALKIADGIKQIKQSKEQIEEQNILIEEKNIKLEELLAAKDKFFSIIGHDLKNPIHIIHTLSEMLLSKINTADINKIEEIIFHVSNTAKEAFKLLENLLNWARLQSGKLKPFKRKVDIKALTDEVNLLLGEIAETKNIKLQNNINESIILNCDEEMTKTVIRNLISNAIKYSFKDSNVSIDAEVENENVVISISDTGVGMDDKTKNGLFRLDMNVSTPGTAEERGTGFGLILCKEFIEKQGGEIKVMSKLGEGSVFKINLPNTFETA